MSFTPTKEQLEELGFIKYNDVFIKKINTEFIEIYDFWIYVSHPVIGLSYNTGLPIVGIQSLEDIRTLIKLLTPPWA